MLVIIILAGPRRWLLCLAGIVSVRHRLILLTCASVLRSLLQVVSRYLPRIGLAGNTGAVTVDAVELVVGSLDSVALLRRERDLRLSAKVLDLVVVRPRLVDIARWDGAAGRVVGGLFAVEQVAPLQGILVDDVVVKCRAVAADDLRLGVGVVLLRINLEVLPFDFLLELLAFLRVDR